MWTGIECKVMDYCSLHLESNKDGLFYDQNVGTWFCKNPPSNFNIRMFFLLVPLSPQAEEMAIIYYLCKIWAAQSYGSNIIEASERIIFFSLFNSPKAAPCKPNASSTHCLWDGSWILIWITDLFLQEEYVLFGWGKSKADDIGSSFILGSTNRVGQQQQ